MFLSGWPRRFSRTSAASSKRILRYSCGQAVILVLLLTQLRTSCHSGPSSYTAADKLSFWSCFWFSWRQAIILVLLLTQLRTSCHSGPASDTAADKLSFWSCFWYSCGQAVILVLLLIQLRTGCHSGPASDTAADKLSFWSCFWYSCGQAVILVLLLIQLRTSCHSGPASDTYISMFKTHTAIYSSHQTVICYCFWYLIVQYLQDDYCDLQKVDIAIQQLPCCPYILVFLYVLLYSFHQSC